LGKTEVVKVVKDVLYVSLVGLALATHQAEHPDITRYVPVIPIVHNGGQVATSTASAMLIWK
jgi:hypothetical protein